MKEKGKFQIFLAHAKEDKARVRELYRKLKEAGYRPWLDKLDLVPGQWWREEIPKAIKGSDLFVACLSETSIRKQGYVQQEFRLALGQYAERPAGEIYLIPLKFDDCDIPDLRQEEYGIALQDIHWLDYWEEDGFEQLLRAIEYRRRGPEALDSPPEPDLRSTAPEVRAPAEVAAVEENPPERSSEFRFEVVRVNERGKEIEREERTNQGFWEDLGNGVRLPMLWIPGGKFMMGSPETERDRSDWEGLQHEVTVPGFYMGKSAITQAQWQAIAANVSQVDRELDPNPARFKGSDRPVEKVSWEDAVEFCARLTQQTGREYRLPSEAEWEYACRAGTTTPFHFGETITTELANYCGDFTYANGPKGEYREETTPVGKFPANAYGLHDMHGNVYEWCADHWHGSYEGAPKDGSTWLSDEDSTPRVIRGGSWGLNPWYCRSAYRYTFNPGDRYNVIGFRVVCSAPRT